MSQSKNNDAVAGQSSDLYHFQHSPFNIGIGTNDGASTSNNLKTSRSNKQCGCKVSANCRSCPRVSFLNPGQKVDIDNVEDVELQNVILNWISKTQFLSENYLCDKDLRKTQAAALAKRLKNLLDDEYLVLNLRDETKKWLNAMPLKYPYHTYEEESKLKSQAIDDLIKTLVNPGNLTPFEREIADWIKWLPVVKKNDNDMDQLFKKIVNKLTPVVLNQPIDREKYKINLLSHIENIVETITFKTDATKHITQPLAIADLASRLSKITPKDAIPPHWVDVGQKQRLLEWLNAKPGFRSKIFLGPHENSMLVDELLNILNVLKQNDKENVGKNIRNHLVYWLQHAAMRKNIYLNPADAEAYTSELLKIVNQEGLLGKNVLFLQNLINQWLLDSTYITYFQDQSHNKKKVKELSIALNNIADDKYFESNAWNHIENWIIDYPIIFYGSKIEQEKRKCEFISNLILKLNDVKKKTSLDREIQEWVDTLPLERPTADEKNVIVIELTEKLRSSLIDQPSDNHEYIKTLEQNIGDILTKNHFKKQSTETIKKMTRDLLIRLEIIPKDTAVKKKFSNKEKNTVFEWLNNIPGFTNVDNSSINDITADLTNILNDLNDKNEASSGIGYRDHLKCWLKHTSLRQKIPLDQKSVTYYVDELMNKLNLPKEIKLKRSASQDNSYVKMALPSKTKIVNDLVDEIGDILYELNVTVDDQDKLDTCVSKTLANMIQNKEIDSDAIHEFFDELEISDEITEGKVLRLCKGQLNFYEEPPFSPEEVKEEIADDLDDVFKNNNIVPDEILKLQTVDILNEYVLGNLEPDKLYQKILDNLLNMTSSENNARSITNKIVNRIKKKKKITLLPIETVKSKLKNDITDVLDQIDIPSEQQNRLTSAISNTLERHILGHATDKETKEKLWTKLRRSIISEPDIQKVTKKLIESSKQRANEYSDFSKKNVRNNIKNKVAWLLQEFDLQVDDKNKLEHLICDVLADFILGYESDKIMQQRLNTRLRRLKVPENKVDVVSEALQHLAREEHSLLHNYSDETNKSNIEIISNMIGKQLNDSNNDVMKRSNMEIISDIKVKQLNQSKTEVAKKIDINMVPDMNEQLNDINNNSTEIFDKLADFVLQFGIEDNGKNNVFTKLQKAIQTLINPPNYSRKTKDSRDWLPSKKVIRFHLQEVLNDKLRKFGIHKDNVLIILDSLLDTVVNYIFSKETEQSCRNKLVQDFNRINVRSETTEAIIDDLLKQSLKTTDDLQVFPLAKEIRSDLSVEIKTILEEKTNVDEINQNDVEALITTIADNITGKEDDIDTKKILLEILTRNNLSNSDAEEVIENLMIFSKDKTDDVKFSVSKKDIKSLLTNDVNFVLDDFGIKVAEISDLEKNIIYTLADLVLGRENDRSARSKIMRYLRTSNLGTSANIICDKLLEKCGDKSKDCYLFAATKKEIKLEMSDAVEDVFDENKIKFKNREITLNRTLDHLADYVMGREDEQSVQIGLQNELKNTTISNTDDVIKELLDISKKEASILRSIPLTKSQLRNDLKSEVFDTGDVYRGIKLSQDTDDKIIGTLANHLLRGKNSTVTKDKLNNYLKNTHIPDTYVRYLTEKLIDKSYVVPLKENIKKELKSDINYLLSSSGINDSTITTAILEVLADTILNNANQSKIKQDLMKCLERSCSSLDKAETIALNIIELSRAQPSLSEIPLKNKLKDELESDVLNILNLSGINKLRRRSMLMDIIVDNIMGKYTEADTETKIRDYLKSNNVPDNLSLINSKKLLKYIQDKATYYETRPSILKLEQSVANDIDKILSEFDVHSEFSKPIREAVIDNILGNDNETKTRITLHEYFKKLQLPDMTAEKAVNRMLHFCDSKIAQYANKISRGDVNKSSKGNIIYAPPSTFRAWSEFFPENYSRATIKDDDLVDLPHSYRQFLVQAIDRWIDTLPFDKSYFDNTFKNELVNHIIARKQFSQLNPNISESDIHEEELLTKLLKRLTIQWTQNDTMSIISKVKDLRHKISNIPVPKLIDPPTSGSSDPIYNKIHEIRQDVIDWTESLPFYDFSEEKENNKKKLQEIAEQMVEKNFALMLKPEVFYDEQLYLKVIQNNMEDLLKFSQNPDFTKSYAAFKNKLVDNMIALRHLMNDKLAGSNLQQDILLKSYSSDRGSIFVIPPEVSGHTIEQNISPTTSKISQTSLSIDPSISNPKLSQPPGQSPTIIPTTPRRHLPNRNKRISISLPEEQQNKYLENEDSVNKNVYLTIAKWFDNLPFDGSNKIKFHDELKSSLKELVGDKKGHHQTQCSIMEHNIDNKNYLAELLKYLTSNHCNLSTHNSEEVLLNTEDLNHNMWYVLMFLCYFSVISVVQDPSLKRDNPNLVSSTTAIYLRVQDLLKTTIEEWTEMLPLRLNDLPEEIGKEKLTKQHIVEKLLDQINKLNLDPNMFEDVQLYAKELESYLDNLLKESSENPNLLQNVSKFKKKIVDDVLIIREIIENGFIGEEYRQEIYDAILNCIPSINLEPQRQASFEILKENIIDTFINFQITGTGKEPKEKLKPLLNDHITKLWDRFLKDQSNTNTTFEDFSNDLLSKLLEVPLPEQKVLQAEVEIAKLRKLISDVFDTIPFKEMSNDEKIEKFDLIRHLSKRLHDDGLSYAPPVDVTLQQTSKKEPVTSTPIPLLQTTPSEEQDINITTNRCYCTPTQTLSTNDAAVDCKYPESSETQTDSEYCPHYQTPKVLIREYFWGSKSEHQKCRNVISSKNIINPSKHGDKPLRTNQSCVCDDIPSTCTIQSSHQSRTTSPSLGRSNTLSNRDSSCAYETSCSLECPGRKRKKTTKNHNKPCSRQQSTSELLSSSEIEQDVHSFLEPCTSLTCSNQIKSYRQKMCEITHCSSGTASTSAARTKNSFFLDYDHFLNHFQELSKSPCPESCPGHIINKRLIKGKKE